MRPVGIDLDAVALRVGKVDRLADQMVGCAVEGDIVVRGMAQPAGKLGAVGHQERGMEEAGGIARGDADILARRQRQERHAVNAQHFAACGLLDDLEAKHRLIETGNQRQRR